MSRCSGKKLVLEIVAILCIGTATTYAQETGARYLIITHPDYADALAPLAEWKTNKGLKAKIVTTTETGSDSTQIRNYVFNAFNNWPLRPEYLLLVGNDDQVPFPLFIFPGMVICHSDNYYTNITGDFRNEIIPGRFWASDTLEAKTVVAKVLGYEKEPYLGDVTWFRKGTTIVLEDGGPPYSDSVYWADARYAHQLMVDAGFIHIDSFAYSFGDSSQDVIDAINDGRTHIIFRGQGVGLWGYPFSWIYPWDMFNGFKLPIVISATCRTIEGIGQWWLNAGTPDEPRGTVGFFGTTTTLYGAAEMRSSLTKGTLASIFCDSLTTLGRAAEAGRVQYYADFNDSLEYYSWTCLGDPAMTMWTSTPKELEVTHSPHAWQSDTLTVHVECNMQPVEDALVCVTARMDSSLYHYGSTDPNGNVVFVDTLDYPDSAFITVTGRNFLPAYDTVVGGYSGGAFVAYWNYLVLDTINGNGNFQPNNGEEIELAVWVANLGDSTAYNVVGVLQKAETDNYYQLTDTIKSFGTIASLDSAFTSDDGFNVLIDPDCPDSHQINLRLTVHDIFDSTWVSYFNFLVYSPRPYVIFRAHMILDTIGGNGNYQVNPAEDIELPVWVQNIGDSIAEDVYGILQKQETDQYFALDDTVKYFGDILPMDLAWTSEDGYNVMVDSSCPDQHEIKLRLRITDSLDSLWIHDFNLINHAPNLVYHNYLVNDSFKYILAGDTAQLTLFIENCGSCPAESVFGSLLCDDTLLTIVNGTASFGTIEPESIAFNQSDYFIIAADPDAPPAHPTDLRLALNAGVYIDTLDFGIYIGQRDYLIWDPDPNHSSGIIINTKLGQLNFLGDYRQNFPRDSLNIYKSLFVCLGMSPDNYVIYDTSHVVAEIEYNLAMGGKMYIEGGDVWYNDPGQGGFDFCPYFCVTPISNNIGYFTGVTGVAGTFTEGMSFNYVGENSSIDRIDPAAAGVAVLKNIFNNFTCGVAANNQTVGISIELSGLVDSVPPSTRLILVDSIMGYFGIMPSGVREQRTGLTTLPACTAYPNPCRGNLCIRFQGIENQQVSLTIYDVMGRCVFASENQTIDSDPFDIIWRGIDNHGRKVSQGVYFVSIDTQNDTEIKKIVLLE